MDPNGPAAAVGDDEDCEVCKKAKKKSAAFQALMRDKGISMPSVPKKQPPQSTGIERPVAADCLTHTSDAAASGVVGCPADRESLGRAGWTVLHTMAAYFPRQPNYAEQASMSVFIRLFANFYPCRDCREDFQAGIKAEPPTTESRASLMGWMCRAHNRVNERLGKPVVDCSIDKLEERWKKGPAVCDADEHFGH